MSWIVFIQRVIFHQPLYSIPNFLIDSRFVVIGNVHIITKIRLAFEKCVVAIERLVKPCNLLNFSVLLSIRAHLPGLNNCIPFIRIAFPFANHARIAVSLLPDLNRFTTFVTCGRCTWCVSHFYKRLQSALDICGSAPPFIFGRKVKDGFNDTGRKVISGDRIGERVNNNFVLAKL